MTDIRWRLVLGVVGVVIALWQIHDKVYANDMNQVDAHLLRVDEKILELIRHDKSGVILMEIKNNRRAIEYLTKSVDELRGKK